MKSILKDSSIFKSEMKDKKLYLFLSTFFYLLAIFIINEVANKYYFYDVSFLALVPKLRGITVDILLNDPYYYFASLTIVTYIFLIKSLISGFEDYWSLKTWYKTLDAALLNNITNGENQYRGNMLLKQGRVLKNVEPSPISNDINFLDIKDKSYGEILNNLYMTFQVMGFAESPDDESLYNIVVDIVDRSDGDINTVYKVLYFDDRIIFLSKELDISYDLGIKNLIELTYSNEDELFANMLASIDAIRIGNKFDLNDLPGMATISYLVLSQISDIADSNDILVTESRLKDIDESIKNSLK